MATLNQEIVDLLPYLDLEHINYVISHVTQKAIDAPSEEGIRSQMDIANSLYQAMGDATAKQTLSESAEAALRRRASEFPEVVRCLINRRL